MNINTILLALIAGLLLVMIAKVEKPEQVDSHSELLAIMLANYLIPLVMAVLCGAIILGCAHLATLL